MIDRLVIAWEMGQRGDREREQTKGERANSSYLIITARLVCSIENLLLSHGSTPHYHIMAGTLAPHCMHGNRGETVNSDPGAATPKKGIST